MSMTLDDLACAFHDEPERVIEVDQTFRTQLMEYLRPTERFLTSDPHGGVILFTYGSKKLIFVTKLKESR